MTLTGTLLPYILLGSMFNSASTRGNQSYTDRHDSFAKISRLIPVWLFVKDVCPYALLF